ncbi:MAG: hypothetical protein WCY54_10520 [Syntrophales bacterium]
MQTSGIRLTIKIGKYGTLRAPRWYIQSDRSDPLGRAGITLPDPDRMLLRSINKGDFVEVTFGHRDREPGVWRGTVLSRGPGETKDQLEIRAVNGAKPLATLWITQAWENETAEAIVRWAVRQTKLPVGRIDATGMVLPHFVASTIPVWQVAQQAGHSCQEAFGLDMSAWDLWLGVNGVNWGNFDEPGAVPVIATGEALIDHAPAEGPGALSRVETFLLPDLMHSRRVRLRDNYRGIDGTFRALRVRHEGTPDRARTWIWYGTLG